MKIKSLTVALLLNVALAQDGADPVTETEAAPTEDAIAEPVAAVEAAPEETSVT